MDRSAEFRMIVKRVFQAVERMTPSDGDVRTELVCDDALGHYQLGQVGWEKRRRIDNIFLHADVLDGKIWIQHDGTDLPLAALLMEEGVPKECIVLAFHLPQLRSYTDFAIG